MAACIVCQAAATVYCHNDEAFLCKDCDHKTHSCNPVAARHVRVKVCELCNKNVSTVYCKNDKAFLCDECDSEIHLNNPLAARHEIVPALDFAKEASAVSVKVEGRVVCDSVAHSETSPESCIVPSEATKATSQSITEAVVPCAAPVMEAAPKVDKDALAKTLFGKDMEGFEFDSQWLDRLDMGFDFSDILGAENDGLVPSLSMDSEGSGDSFAVPSLGHPDVSVPSADTKDMEVAEETRVSTGSLLDENDAAEGANALVGPAFNMDRKARVERYREKRKNRKFEKTIRYESRKAYAEIRPRIKGRFAKREEVMAWKAAEAAIRNRTMDASFDDGDVMVVPSL